MSICCENCFSSEVARRFICEHGSTGPECEYCEATGHATIEASALEGLFTPLLELYESAEDIIEFFRMADGNEEAYHQSLSDLICEDWNVLNENIGSRVMDQLLGDILYGSMDHVERHYNTYATDDAWIRSEDGIFGEKAENTWDWFAHHLKHDRRFIIGEDPGGGIVRPEKWLKEAIEILDVEKCFPAGTKFFRGRLGCAYGGFFNSAQPFPSNEMAAPPRRFASASRANPEGIPVLYIGTTPQVAVAEAGRSPGATVSVRAVKTIEYLKVVDLTEVPALGDPLGRENFASIYRYRRILLRLNEELSKPIHSSEAKVEYIPTQYLAEAIRVIGYDGIYYKSCMQPNGHNLVIFDPRKAEFTDDAAVYKIQSITLEIENIPNLRPS